MNPIRPKKPEKIYNMPIWHHHHSSKIIVEEEKLAMFGNTLTMKGSAVTVVIQSNWPGPGRLVSYTIRHSNPCHSSGLVWMGDEDMRIAFGLSDSCVADFGQHIIDQYGGDVAYQGKYIRFGPYLNIPGPGTGHDGDPNVSIYLTEEIKMAITKLLASN